MGDKVFLFGTFDVDNYGDLLFPVVASWRLGGSLIAVSPTNNKPTFDCLNENFSVSLQEFSPKICLGALIGGGNIVHFRPSSVFPYLGNPLSYAGLQFYPISGSLKKNFPVIYNSPSIANPRLDFIDRHLLRVVLNSADYLSFRDRHSVDLAKNLTNKKVFFVPDTAFDISRVWARDPHVRPTQQDYFIVHVNKRYGGEASNTAKAIDLICNKTKMKAVFLPIGPCHGDKEYARLVAGMMENKPVIVETLSLKIFAQYISNSAFYLGSSMHGFITALAYGVKAGLVLKPSPMAKFQGVLDFAKLPSSVISKSWLDASAQLDDIPVINAESLALIHRELDQHWNRVQELLLKGVKPKRPRISIRYWKLLVLVPQFFTRVFGSLRRKISGFIHKLLKRT